MAQGIRFDRAKLQDLRRRLPDSEIIEALQSLESILPSANLVTLGPRNGAVRRTSVAPSIRDNFRWAVEGALRREGGGLESAVATVLVRLQGGIELVPSGDLTGTLPILTGLAESVLTSLVEHRPWGETREQTYIALVSSLTLAEAMNLGPGLAGLAVGEGTEHEIATAARLLKVPAVSGIPKVCEVAGEGDIVRLDGDAGTLDVVARLTARTD